MQSLTFKFNKKLYFLEKLTDFYFQIKCENFPPDLIIISDFDDVWLKKGDSQLCPFCFKGWYLCLKKGEIFLRRGIPKTLDEKHWTGKIDDHFFERLSFFIDNFAGSFDKWEIWSLKSSSTTSSRKVTTIPYELCDRCNKRLFIQANSSEKLKLFYKKGDRLLKDFKSRLNSPVTKVEEGLDQLKNFLLKETVGFVSYFNTFQESGLPNNFLKDLYLSTLLTELPSFKNEPFSILCGGEDKNEGIAQVKAIMEFIERYALMNISLASPILNRGETDNFDLPNYCSLERFIGHFKKELTTPQFLKNFSNHLVWGVDVVKRDKVLLPLQALFNARPFLKKYGIDLDGYVPPTSSNGFAAHFDAGEALKKSVFELVERDAFIRWWMRPEEVEVFQPEGKSELALNRIVGSLREILSEESIEARLLLLPSPLGVPVIFAFISSCASMGPAILVGASADFDVSKACLKAISELEIAVLNFIARFQKDPNWLEKHINLKDFKNIKTPTDHIYFYHHPEILPKLKFLNKILDLKQRPMDNLTGPQNIEQFKEKVLQQKMHWYAIDATPEVFKKLGVFVARSFVPELYPLYFGATFPFKLDKVSPLSVASSLPHCFP